MTKKTKYIVRMQSNFDVLGYSTHICESEGEAAEKSVKKAFGSRAALISNSENFYIGQVGYPAKGGGINLGKHLALDVYTQKEWNQKQKHKQ